MISFKSNLPLSRTGLIPDERDTAQIKEIMQLQQETIADIDKRMNELEATIRSLEMEVRNLHTRREAISKSLAVNSSLFAPIRRLLPELLGEIFNYCIPPKITEHSGREHFEEPPILLLRVCCRWRDVAQKTPQLWTQIPICGPREHINFATRFLRCAGSLPIDIKLRESGWWSQDINFREFTEFSELLVEKAPFFRRLVYSGSFDGFSISFPSGNGRNLSIEELSVRIGRAKGNLRQFSEPLEMPRLHTLELIFSAFSLMKSIQWTASLTKLTLWNPDTASTTAAEILRFLGRCSGLQEMLLGGLCLLSGSECPVLLANLLTLEVHCSSACGQFLSVLRTPNLRSAILHCYGVEDTQVSRFIHDVRTSLRTLRICELEFSSAPLIREAMATLDELETLTMDWCLAHPPGDLWKWLTPDESNHRICPKLSQLELSSIKLGSEFLEFIERRAEAYYHSEGAHERAAFRLDVVLPCYTACDDVVIALQKLKLEREIEGLSITGLHQMYES